MILPNLFLTEDNMKLLSAKHYLAVLDIFEAYFATFFFSVLKLDMINQRSTSYL